MSEYQDFLARKTLVTVPTGIPEPPELHPSLFPFQRDVTRWALRRGRAALFEECGLGKSRQAIEWARVVAAHAGGNVLILTPLAVAAQFVREGAAIGVEVTHCRESSDVRPGVNVTNYERFDRFAPSQFAGVVLDECFAAGTLVETPTGATPIEEIRSGHAVVSAAGLDHVTAVHRREVPSAIKITAGFASCVCSPNHPFFTERGWVPARALRADDRLLETAAAMRLVREGVLTKEPVAGSAAFLREVLLGEMADDAAGDSCSRAQSRGSRVTREETIGVAGLRIGQSEERDRADSSSEPNGIRAVAGSVQSSAAGDGVLPKGSRREWSRAYVAAAGDVGRAGPGVDSRVSGVPGEANRGVSDELQARPSESGTDDRHRSGRSFALQSARDRSEEGRQAGFVGVDRIEILEPGHPELERLRDADGKLYFYDLEVARHPSFSVNGCLVHNSSILKAKDGKTRTALIQAWQQTPFRLACTATPAPNDHQELGNHAEFLGVMTQSEMLSMFFVHDGGETQKWRLKGHAEKDFWRWVCSWAVCLTKPSGLGYSDAGYELPPLRIHEHIIESDQSMARQAGMLFSFEAKTLDELRAARRASLPARVAKAAELANSDNDQWICWCDLNDESKAITKSIPGAVEITGSDKDEKKEQAVLDFIDGKTRVIVSKPSICGFGVNLQNANKSAFVGLSHSFEQWHQANRRLWRFGQRHAVDSHIITSSAEGAVLASIQRKREAFEAMISGMAEHMADFSRAEIRSAGRTTDGYAPAKTMRIPRWLQEAS